MKQAISEGPPLPLSADELMLFAQIGRPIPLNRALATFADPNNWIQLYQGKSVKDGYRPKECKWAFIGPVRPPYELAQNALENLK